MYTDYLQIRYQNKRFLQNLNQPAVFFSLFSNFGWIRVPNLTDGMTAVVITRRSLPEAAATPKHRGAGVMCATGCVDTLCNSALWQKTGSGKAISENFSLIL